MGFSAFLLMLLCVMGLFVGLIHIGFAMTDPHPRNVWDWYVVVIGIGCFGLYFPATAWLIQQ
ncbi:MAG: hypothetical protein JWR80_9995 [Bradyrhizobium sp.]|nr:hypothetical protein [Bradyrhizobium sp.]